MIFKKDMKAEIFCFTVLFLILLGFCTFLVFYINSDKKTVQIIISNWGFFLFLILCYIAALILKIKIGKNKTYIIEGDKIIFKSFNGAKEININNIETIVNSSGATRLSYYLYITGGTIINVRYDMYNEDGETLYDVLKEKYKIKVIVNNIGG